MRDGFDQRFGLLAEDAAPAGTPVKHIGAEVEVIAAERIDDAYERVLASDVRYRFVIDTAALG